MLIFPIEYHHLQTNLPISTSIDRIVRCLPTSYWLVMRAGLFEINRFYRRSIALSCRAKPSGNPTSARRKPAPTAYRQKMIL